MRVFAHALPDTVGLKEVAKEAGVSHALVTHYFGTYDALVETVVAQKVGDLRAYLLSELAMILSERGDVAEMLAGYRRALRRAAKDRVMVRLATWALLSGRFERGDFVTDRVQGLRMLADALEQQSGLPRDDLEFAIIASFGLTLGWSVAGRGLAGSLGRRHSAEDEEAFEARTRALVDAHLRAAKRRTPR